MSVQPIPCLFLDRDGTIIVERDYLSDPELVKLEVGAVQGLRRFRDAGFRLVVVSNQSGLARGYFDEAALRAVNARLGHMLLAQGIEIASWHHCPHEPRDACNCRKPLPGLLDQAEAALPGDLSIDWCASVMVGDKASDVAAGRARGTRTALVRTGHGLQDAVAVEKMGIPVCDTLEAVADIFLKY
jgi:histidinol-phosphate phosphatase family protein